MQHIKVIGFDADDTLWSNETYFREAEEEFCNLMAEYLSKTEILNRLLEIEIRNLEIYGYGIKAFVLSMIETAMEISNKRVSQEIIDKILTLGKEQLNKPVNNLSGVEETLKALKNKYKLIVVTKGDLLDQERKLIKSGLIEYFHHIEIVSEKNEKEYLKLLKHLEITPEEFLMVGNSLKSDVLPILNLGGYGIHIPFHTTWEHERIDVYIENDKFKEIDHISEVLEIVNQE